MSNGVAKFDKLNVAKDIIIAPPEKMRNGMGTICKFEPVSIQLPSMRVPWDCRPLPPMNGEGRFSCKLAMSFDERSDKLAGEHKTLFDMLSKIDTKSLAHIRQHKAKFFTKKPPSDALLTEELYHKSVKESNGDHTPIFQSKVDFREVVATSSVPTGEHNGSDPDVSEQGGGGKRAKVVVSGGDPEYTLNIKCFEKTGELIPPHEALAQNNEIITIVSPQYIWQVNNRCGITWMAKKCVVVKRNDSGNGFDFDLS